MEAPSLTTVQKQILKFFKENPHAVETVRGIATWLASADAKAVQEAVEDLCARKLLLCHESGSVSAYVLNPDEIQDPI